MRTNRTILYCDNDSNHLDTLGNAIVATWKRLFSEDIVVKCCEDIRQDRDLKHNILSWKDVAKYDLLLLDIAWGPSDEPHGIEIANLIRAKYPEKPIIVFSGKVQLDDFKVLIPLGISGYLTKVDATAQSWCAQIRNVLARECEDKAGQVLYQKLRTLLAGDEAPWHADIVSTSASQVWRNESTTEKWTAFWTPWVSDIAKRKLTLPFKKMKDLFAGDELLTLSLDFSMRGHLDHVLYVYYTGYLLSHSIDNFRDYVLGAVKKLVGPDYDESKSENYWDMFQFAWLVCATLHDTAYPIEVLPNVRKRCEDIIKVCPFAEFNSKTPAKIETKRINWTESSASEAEGGFKDVLFKLTGDDQLFDWLRKNSKFKDSDGVSHFNHGIVSGILFLGEVSKWDELSGQPKELPVFNGWAATAMALHALKKAKSSKEHSVSLSVDPLSFLLLLSDELQVWNRNRPNENIVASGFRRIELTDLQVEGESISARLDYVPKPEMLVEDDDADGIINAANEKLQEENRLIDGYLDPRPYKVHIDNVVSQWDKSLTDIDIQ